jgi:hypothetical protein
MAETVNVIVATEDHELLLAINGDRNCPLKHVQRAKIVAFRRAFGDSGSRAPSHRQLLRRLALETAIRRTRNR